MPRITLLLFLLVSIVLPVQTEAATNVSGDITQDTAWTLPGSPYIVTGNIAVRHPTTSNGPTVTLTIEPGVEVRFNPGTGLRVGYESGSSLYRGALSARGTFDAPITFTSSAAAPAAGDWNGILFDTPTDSSQTVLENCVVEYGGSGAGANIRIYNSSPTVKRSIIRNSGGRGIYLNKSSSVIGGDDAGNSITGNASYGLYCEDATGSPIITDNTISNNGSYPLRVRAMMNDVHDNAFSGNGEQAVEVIAEDITADTTWRNIGLPYIITGTITVRHPTTSNGPTVTLTIEPGVEVGFNPGTGLRVGYESGSSLYRGALSARGTFDAPIRFTSSAAAPAAGDWSGILFDTPTDSGLTVLENCVVEYGGAGAGANIHIYASTSIRYCKIRYSGQYGVYITGNTSSNVLLTCNVFAENRYGIYADGTPAIHDNNFLGNLTAGINNAGSSAVDATSNWWGDAAGPNHGGDVVSGNVNYTPWLTASSECAATGNRAPSVPGNPSPANGAVGVPLTGGGSVVLGWTGGDPDTGDTVSYDVYFGTAPSSLAKIDGAVAATAYTVSGASPVTTYYWQVNAKDRRGTVTAGPVWGFTTWGADLVISVITVDPPSGIAAGQLVNLTAVVRNDGDGPASSAFLTDFRVDGQSIGTRSVAAGLLPGATTQVTVAWTALAGSHSLAVVADSGADVAELNEANNSLSRSLAAIPDMTPPEILSANLPAGGYMQTADRVAITLVDRYGGSLDEAFIIGRFTVRDGSGQIVAGTVTRVGDQFIFIPASSFADGTYQVSITARDMSGNTTDHSFSFTLDSAIPAGPVITGGSIMSGLIQARPAVNWSGGYSAMLTGTREPNTAVWLKYQWAQSRILRVGSGQPYATIQSAVDAAADGDLILIEPGVYSENVTMTKWVHLKGNSGNQDDVVIRHPNDGSGSLVPAMTSANPTSGAVHIEGIRIEAMQTGQSSLDLSNLTGSGELIFNRCKLIAPNGWSIGSFGYNGATNASVEFRNCSIERGAGHFYHMKSSQWKLVRTVLNNDFYCYLCDGSPNPSDYATAATDGYGADYGVWRLTAAFEQAVAPLGTGDWSVPVALNPGLNSLEVWLVDAAENRGPSEWVDISVDTAAPLVLSVAPADGSFTNNASTQVSIEFREDGSGINLGNTLRSLKRGGQEVAGDWGAEGSRLVFTPGAVLTDAEYTIDLRVEDNQGNRSQALQYHFTVDTVAPPTPSVDPVTSPTPNRNQAVRGLKEAYAAIILNGQEIVGHTPETLWQYTVTLFQGENQLAFIVEDRAGNRSGPLNAIVHYDDVAPQAVDTLTVNGQGIGTTASLNWTGYNEATHGDVASYQVYVEPSAFTDVSGLTPKATANAGTFTHQVTGLTKGSTYWFAVVASDRAGNFRPEVTSFSAVILDKTAPEEVTNLRVQSFATRLVFTWTHSAGSAGDLSGYRVYFNGEMEEIQRSADVTGAEKAGLTAATSYPFRITSYDQDGNESAGASLNAITLLNNPGGLAAFPWSGYVDLTWSPVTPSAYVKQYLIYVSESPFTTVEGTTPRISATSAAARVSGLTNNVTYYFAVTTVNLSDGERNEVTPVPARPTADMQGPGVANLQMGGAPFSGGATLHNSGFFALDAADPSGISRVEFFLDGMLIRTSTGGSHHECWLDLAVLADGSHTLTVKTYDTLGNSTTSQYEVTLALDPPGAPVISQPSGGITTNRPSLTVSGSAERGTQVALFLNGVQQGGFAVVDGSGGFTLPLTLASGENGIRAAARNRAGIGPQSAEVLVTLDTSIPLAPAGLSALGRAGGTVRLDWQAALGQVQGYHIYRSSSSFGTTGQAQRLTVLPTTATSYEDLPTADGLYFYRVTVVNQAGNESALSAEASTVSDRVPPRATMIQYAPSGAYDPATARMAAGAVNVRVTVSKPLQSIPFLSITPEGGVPIAVQLIRNGDLEYAGLFVISEMTTSGIAYAVFSGRDMVGNRGTEIDAGGSIRIDTAGPAVSRLAVSPQDPIKASAQDPITVTVTAGLNERVKNGTTPELTWLLSGTGRQQVPVAWSKIATQSGDAETWQGAFALPSDAGQSVPESVRFSFRAVDDLNNTGTKITGRSVFQVYQGTLPPVGVPDNVKAKALPAGKILVTWDAVTEAAGYRIYRQAPGEGGLSEYQGTVAGVEYTDATSSEGLYVYALASLRDANGQQSVSGMSTTALATADSVAPTPPQNLELILSGQGIVAQWQATSSPGLITYSLYRSPLSLITTVAGLTPTVTGIRQPRAVDPTPSASEHCYAVTSVDEAGNESPPSNSVYLNFNLLPVASLMVRQQDAEAPVVNWTTTGGNVTGYDIYVGQEASRVKLNQSPLTTTMYSDTGYTGEERRYGVVALDASQQGSPERSLTLPALKITLKAGSSLHRGVMNRLEYTVENRGTAVLEQAQLKVTLGSRTHVSTFALEAGEARMVPVIVGGYGDLPGQALVTATVEWAPNAGENVEIVRTATLPVEDGMLTLELLNEQFTRGGSGKVSFTLRNTGAEEIEITTARDTWESPSDEIAWNLLDKDNNVLSVVSYKQISGEGLVTLGSGRTVVRIPAGQVFSADSMDIIVPLNAPDNLTIRLTISSVYYHQGKLDQVKMAGLSGTRSVKLIDTAYYGDVTSVLPENSTGDRDITITGRAIERGSGVSLRLVPLKLVVSLDGFERQYDVMTKEDGTFIHTFVPLAGEGGEYTVRAVHPEVTDKPIQGRFMIGRVSVTPQAINVNIPTNYEQTIPLNVITGKGTSVNNLRVVFDALSQPGGVLPPGVHVIPGNPLPTLFSGEAADLVLTLWADNTAAKMGKLVLRVVSDETPNNSWGMVVINTHFSDAAPALYYTPDHVETGVSRGETVTETVTLSNRGLANMTDVALAVILPDGSPAPAWVVMNGSTNQGTLNVGEMREIPLTFSPTSALSEGIYTFYLRVSSSNYPTTDIRLYASVTQSGTGGVLFKVSDIYTGTVDRENRPIEGLTGAKVRVQNEAVLTVDETKTTDILGEALFDNLPAGSYRCRITAGNHKEYTGRFRIKPALVETQAVFLSYNLVTVEWEVRETTIQDRYEIVLNATYETDVPAAVVVAEPMSITLPKMKTGDIFTGEFTLTNHGLIRAEDLTFTLPRDDPYFRYELLSGLPKMINAKERVTIPYRVTCIKSPDQQQEQGSGGAGGGCGGCIFVTYCYVCSKGLWVPGSSSICLSCPIEPLGGGGSELPTIEEHGVRGNLPEDTGAPPTSMGEGCLLFIPDNRKDPPSCNSGGSGGGGRCPKDTETDGCFASSSSINAANQEYNRDALDLSVKVPGGRVELRRWYYKNRWNSEQAYSNLILPPEDEALSSGGSSIKVPEGTTISSQQMSEQNLFPKIFIDKGGVPYKKISKDHYTSGANRIFRQSGIWRWETPSGEWKEYNSDGRMMSSGDRNGIIAKLLYDVLNKRLIGIADRNDRQVIWYEYDVDGRVSVARDLDNRRVEYTYAGGLPVKIKGVLGEEISYEYDGYGRLIKTIDAAGHESRVTYDTNGLLTAVADGDGRGQSVQFNAAPGGRGFYSRIRTTTGKIKEIYLDGERDVVRVDLNGRTVKRIYKDGRNHLITDEAGNVIRKEYDEWDNLTKVVYPDGTSRTYEYERRFNKRTKETDERRVVTTYEYDTNGNLTRKQEAVGTTKVRMTTYTNDGYGQLLTLSAAGDGQTQAATSSMTYDTNGNVTSITDPEGNTTRFTHDNMGNILTREDGLGKVWTYEYDAKGRLTKATDPNGNMMVIASDGAGNVVRREDPSGKATVYEYSQSNRLTRRTDALGGVIAFAYDGDNNLIGLTDPEGKSLAAEYDLDGRLVRATDGHGNVIWHVYDDVLASGCSSCAVNTSKPSRTIFPTFTREYRYDKRSRKTLEQDILGAEGTYMTRYAYDSAGNLISKTDREDRTTTYEYDEFNRLVRVTNPLNGQTAYAYDNRDNLISLTDAKGNVTSFNYDRNNRLIKEARPLGQETTYQYDANGGLIRKRDAKGQRIEYGYDDSGRMVQIRHYAASGALVKTISLTYDNVGNLNTYTDGTTSAAYDYDDLSRKTQETVNYGAFSLTTSYAYNKNGTKKSFTYPGGVTIDYTYDGNNQPLGMKIPGAGYLTYNTYRWNRPTAITLPGGGTKQYDYDSLMRARRIVVNDPGQNRLLDYQYVYDKMDDITQKNTEHGNYTYTYDELYRLIQASNANQTNEAYTYDQVGNRLTSTAASNWTYNQNNELQSYDGVNFQYDANGNTIQKNDGAQIINFVYDIDNRLIEVRDGSNNAIAAYVYDPFGRRIAKTTGGTTTYYLYSDEGLIGEYDSTGTEIKLYGYKPDSAWTTDPVFMKEGSNYYFYHNDHLGTPQKMTTISGAVVWSASYDAFGKAMVDVGSAITTNLRFPGQYYDHETRLHYNWHRFYNPMVGRYATEDPIGFEEGVHFYLYTENSPVNKFDEWGLFGDGINAGGGKWHGHSDFFGNKKFDYTLEDKGETAPTKSGSTWRHFRNLTDIEVDLEKDIQSGNKESFIRHMHQAQDYFVHYKKGHRKYHGLGVDEDEDAWWDAQLLTIKWVKKWEEKWKEKRNCGF